MILADWAAGFCALATSVNLASVLIAALRLGRRKSRDVLPNPAPEVTLLRPVCGIEPYTTETLGSSFRLDYPSYEVIFCVARGDDPVVAIVQRLIRGNPQVPARLLVGDERISINPKLNNLAKGWGAAGHSWIVMADSNVVLPRDALHRLLGRWQGDCGAVCSMPIASRPGNFWAELECAWLNTLEARFEYVSEALGCGFAQGKVMLLRRDLVDDAGGFGVLAADTAEDAATTKMARAAGCRVHLVDRPFEQPLGRRGAAEVWARQLRWARLRRMSFPVLFLPELLLGSLLPGIALAIAAARYGYSMPLALGLPMALSAAAEAALARGAGWHFSWKTALALPLRDALLPVLWVAAWTGRGFVWRGTPMRAQRRADLPAAADLGA